MDCGQPWLGACSVTSSWGWCGSDGGLCPRGRPQAWLNTVGQPGATRGVALFSFHLGVGALDVEETSGVSGQTPAQLGSDLGPASAQTLPLAPSQPDPGPLPAGDRFHMGRTVGWPSREAGRRARLSALAHGVSPDVQQLRVGRRLSGPRERPVFLWLPWAPSLPFLCKHAHTGTSRSPRRAGFYLLLSAPGAWRFPRLHSEQKTARGWCAVPSPCL